jgi:hypothetical protein
MRLNSHFQLRHMRFYLSSEFCPQGIRDSTDIVLVHLGVD